MACRSNLAMCKLKTEEYDHVIDQCERVLEYDPRNVKASFRMSQAAFALVDNKSLSQLAVALKHATVARDGQPTNAQITAHFNVVKAKHDEVAKEKAEEEAKNAPTQPASSGNSMADKMKSRVKIPVDGEDDEETKGENRQPAAPQPQPQQQIPTQ